LAKLGVPPEELKELYRNNPRRAAWFAIHELGDRWPEAEPVIMRDAKAAYVYARDVIAGRWPEAEEIINADPQMKAAYERDVLPMGGWLQRELEEKRQAWRLRETEGLEYYDPSEVVEALLCEEDDEETAWKEAPPPLAEAAIAPHPRWLDYYVNKSVAAFEAAQQAAGPYPKADPIAWTGGMSEPAQRAREESWRAHLLWKSRWKKAIEAQSTRRLRFKVGSPGSPGGGLYRSRANQVVLTVPEQLANANTAGFKIAMASTLGHELAHRAQFKAAFPTAQARPLSGFYHGKDPEALQQKSRLAYLRAPNEVMARAYGAVRKLVTLGNTKAGILSLIKSEGSQLDPNAHVGMDQHTKNVFVRYALQYAQQLPESCAAAVVDALLLDESLDDEIGGKDVMSDVSQMFRLTFDFGAGEEGYSVDVAVPWEILQLAGVTSREAIEEDPSMAEEVVIGYANRITPEVDRDDWDFLVTIEMLGVDESLDEAVLIPAAEHVDAIIGILRNLGRKSIEELNRELAPHHARIQGNPVFDQYPGSVGGVFGGVFLLNPAYLLQVIQQPGRLRQVIVHELIHALQRSRSKPEDMGRIDANDAAKLNRLGPEEYYNQEPLEAMALAKGAYDAMIAAGVDPLDALRKGTASRYSPIPGIDSRRFSTYLYQYATGQGVTESQDDFDAKEVWEMPPVPAFIQSDYNDENDPVFRGQNIRVDFSAVAWLQRASFDQIRKLAHCGWGGDYPADDVARGLAPENRDLRKFFAIVDWGFEVHVDQRAAEAFLKQFRPEIYQQLRREGEILEAAPATAVEAKTLPDVSATDGFDATGWLLQASDQEIESLVESQFKLDGIQFDPEQTKALLLETGRRWNPTP